VTSLDEATLREAIDGDRVAIRAVVTALTPVVQARVVRGLLRRRPAREGRDIRQEVDDMMQEVFAALFAHGGRALRAWAPDRGLSLENFVGLIAERQVVTILRSQRRNPWRDVPEELDALEPRAIPDEGGAPGIESRSSLELLLDRLREALSPRGLELFQRLYVEEEPVEEVARSMSMTREAIYAWRNRVSKVLAGLAGEIRDGAPLDPALSRRTPEREPSDG